MNGTMGSAIDLMIVGMGFVFGFLIILVFVTMIMSRIAMRIAPPETNSTPPRRGGNAAGGGSSPMDDPKLMAVISAAVSKHRARHRK